MQERKGECFLNVIEKYAVAVKLKKSKRTKVQTLGELRMTK